VQYDASNLSRAGPGAAVFLTQFVVKHFSRLRATVQRSTPSRCSSSIQRWLTAPSPQRPEPHTRNVLDDASADEVTSLFKREPERVDEAPYKASISFQKCCTRLHPPERRVILRGQVDFVLRDHVPNEFVRVNRSGSRSHTSASISLRGAATMIANTAFLAVLTCSSGGWLAGELRF